MDLKDFLNSRKTSKLQIDTCSTLFRDVPLSFDVLQKIELDLELYEKISLVFLLYDEVAVSQERLSLLIRASGGNCFDNGAQMNLLHDWAVHYGKYWKEKLTEALLIIQAYKNIKMLGLDLALMKNHFLPGYPYTSLFVHPVKKALYAVCEELTIKDSERIVKAIIADENLGMISTDQVDSKYFELFILKLIRKRYINLGSWAQQSSSIIIKSDFIPANIASFALCLKKLGFEKQHNTLLSSETTVNSTSESNMILLPSLCRLNISESSSADEFKLPNAKSFTTCDRKNDSTISYELSSKSSILSQRSNVYPISNPEETGIVFIINEVNFKKSNDPNNELKCRKGSDVDKDRLIDVWKMFGFESFYSTDISAHEILTQLEMVVHYIVRKEHSVFVLCILSHGQKGEIIAQDGVPVPIEKIEEILYTSNAPLLAGKPKIIIVQSCQGQKHMDTVQDIQKDKGYVSSTLQTDSPCRPEKCDILIFWATVPNFVSYRDTEHGTWFIQTLCTRLENDGHLKHFSDICTDVNGDIIEKRDGNHTQMSQFTSCFTKQLYLQRITD